jgi:hypothetical protein
MSNGHPRRNRAQSSPNRAEVKLRQYVRDAAVFASPLLLLIFVSCVPKPVSAPHPVTVSKPVTATHPAPTSPTVPMPTAANTGVPPGLTLKTIDGNINVTKPDTVLSGLDIHGFVRVQTTGVTIKNSRIHGSGPGSYATGLIDANNPAVHNLVIENCDLNHDAASVWVDGVVGHDYTAVANDVHNVVDGFGVMNPRNPTADLNVNIENNYVHDLDYLSPDSTHPDNHTHNDAIQIQGAGASLGERQIRISGNNLQALAGPDSNTRSPYYPAVTGQAIAVTPNVSAVHDVDIDGNWLDGGAQTVTIIPGPKGAGTGIRLTNNRFGGTQGTGQPVLIQPPIAIYAANNTGPTGKPIAIG